MKEFNRDEPVGYCCGDTKNMLLQCIDDIQPKNIAEVGSFKGMSAYFMCCKSNAHIYCIDHWKGSKEHQGKEGIESLYETFIDNMQEFNQRITTIRMGSDKGLRKLKELCPEVDMIFIDGDHSYSGATLDISLSLELFPDATICGDDFSWSSVSKAVKDICKDYNRYYTTIKDRSWRIH